MKKTAVIKEIYDDGIVSFQDGTNYATAGNVRRWLDRYHSGDEVELNIDAQDCITFLGKPGQGKPQTRASAPAPKNSVPAQTARPAAPAPAVEKKGDWPTREEREASGKRIGRQACLNTAVEICKLQLEFNAMDKTTPVKTGPVDAEDVVTKLAERLEKWVARA